MACTSALHAPRTPPWAGCGTACSLWPTAAFTYNDTAVGHPLRSPRAALSPAPAPIASLRR
eukprot:2466265-Prymnesium_polylepis.1